MRKLSPGTVWNWLWIILGILYFFVPLITTFDFSLRQVRDQITLTAYENVFADPEFGRTFGYSLFYAILTIIFGILLIVPTAFWIHLYLPKLRPVMEVLTLLPFVVPPIILCFGLIGVFSRPPLLLTVNAATTTIILIAGYIVISLPYLYRSVDVGLRSMDVRALTEAAQSLGASWFTILFRVILPNLRTALLTGSLLTLAIVIGEITFATFLGLPAFAPYLWLLGQHKAYEPAALSIISYLLTWAVMGLIFVFTGGGTKQASMAGAH